MEYIDIKQLSYADRKAIEERAHQLRAQALQDVVIMVAKFVKTVFRNIGHSLASYRQSRVGIKLVSTPPPNSQSEPL